MGRKINPGHILISRTDSIGDVMLTLPLATFLKQVFPHARISFLGQSYTAPVINCCKSIDAVYEWNKIKELSKKQQIGFIRSLNTDTIIHVFPDKEIARIAKKAGIKNRIATSHRFYTLFNCNYRIGFNRKNSDLHEAQLNFKLLKPLGIDKIPSRKEIAGMYDFFPPSPSAEIKELIKKEKINIILHPKSKGSAREWGMKNFTGLINILPEEKFEIFISGVQQDLDEISEYIKPGEKGNVHIIAGKYSLAEFISFISLCDGLVAASTGPLHIAAALGKKAIGLFVPLRPMHPGRWEPLGENALAITSKEQCDGCPVPASCVCMQNITPAKIAELLLQ